jgi:hypothetical protein
MRVILKCSRRVPVRVMLETLGWLSIKQRIFYRTLQLVKKIKLGLVPDYIMRETVLASGVHDYPTRRRDDFRLKRCHSSAAMNSLFYKGLNVFNKMPNEAKNCDSMVAFNKICVNFIKEICPL